VLLTCVAHVCCSRVLLTCVANITATNVLILLLVLSCNCVSATCMSTCTFLCRLPIATGHQGVQLKVTMVCLSTSLSSSISFSSSSLYRSRSAKWLLGSSAWGNGHTWHSMLKNNDSRLHQSIVRGAGCIGNARNWGRRYIPGRG